MRPSPANGSPVDQHPEWEQLLVYAVNTPGVISAGYTRFWTYSLSNQVLAYLQCLQRGIEPGPIHTFKGWLDLGRHVKRGEKAITLLMPVTVKRKRKANAMEPTSARVGDGAERQLTGAGGVDAGANVATVFVYKNHWFLLSQTDGEPYQPTESPAWSESLALHNLLIERIPFTYPDGNCQGYALQRQFAVSPIAVLPHKTAFHELAHIVLHHTDEADAVVDDEKTPRNLREVEAEAVALFCCESLGLPGAPECRGYIQAWLGKEVIPDRNAQRIFKAADQILKAGRASTENSTVPTMDLTRKEASHG